MMVAPSRGDVVAYALGHGQRLPPVDERLVAPETHTQIIDGVAVRTMGANPPHSTRHFEAAHVFAGAIADGYEGAVDMLTRSDADTDAAPDISVFPSGSDPITGGRKLEEIAFEVLDSERLAHASAKVAKLAARGVRRLFAIRVASKQVYEWSTEHGDWMELSYDTPLVDRCFRVPVPVAAFVERLVADDTVAAALLAKKNRIIKKALEDERKRGETQGQRDGFEQGQRDGRLQGQRAGLYAMRATLLMLIEARHTLTDAQRAAVTTCKSLDVLQQWATRIVAGDDVGTVLGA
jgi:flagellar biosynthesis/type III secretory pathway protein FliH